MSTNPQWFHADEARQPLGPLSPGELIARLRARRIQGDTLVWREGMPGWQPLHELAAELGLDPVETAGSRTGTVPPPEPFTAETLDAAPAYTSIEGTPPSTDAGVPAFSWNSSDSLDAHHRRDPASPYSAPQAPVATPRQAVVGGNVIHAGFWKRTAAYLIDYFIVVILGWIVGMVFATAVMLASDAISNSTSYVLLQGMSLLTGQAISAVFFGWFHSSSRQATPGKMLIGIKVVRGDGEPITFVRGIARYFGLLLSTLLAFLGLIMTAFTPRKQALHDLICDTLVVDKWAFTSHPERQRPELGVVTWIVLVLGGLVGLVLSAVMGMALWGTPTF